MRVHIARLSLLALVACTFLCCKGKTSGSTASEESKNLPIVLSLENVHNQKGEELLSSLNAEITYIPLETKDESIIRQVSKVILLKNGNILISDQASLQLFSPEGKHIRSVSQKGNGPADYIRISALAANPQTGGFFIQSNKKVIEFDSNGEYIGNFHTEDRPMDMVYEPDGHLLLHRMNLLKAPEDTVPTWFLFRYDTSGTEVKRFADGSPRIKHSNVIPTSTPVRPLYIYKGKARFNEFGNDTLFTVGNQLEPYAIFQLGEMQMSATPEGSESEINAVFAEMGKKLFLASLREDDTFFYMTFGWGFGNNCLYATYNKKNSQVINYGNGTFNETTHGLTNDIDGSLPFFPQVIDPNGTRIMPWQASNLKEVILNMDYDTQKKEYGERFEKVYQLAQSLDEEDNPVLMLVK